MVAVATWVSNLCCTRRPAANTSHQVDTGAVTHRGVTARAVQTGVWEVPTVLSKALLIDAMASLLLIIFTAASGEHAHSSGFLLPCLFPAVRLQTQAVVCALTKNLEHLLPP